MLTYPSESPILKTRVLLLNTSFIEQVYCAQYIAVLKFPRKNHSGSRVYRSGNIAQARAGRRTRSQGWLLGGDLEDWTRHQELLLPFRLNFHLFRIKSSAVNLHLTYHSAGLAYALSAKRVKQQGRLGLKATLHLMFCKDGSRFRKCLLADFFRAWESLSNRCV